MSGQDWVRAGLAYIIVIGFHVIIAAFFYLPVKGDNTLLNVMLGGLSTVGFAGVINFFYGSSSSSKEKDAALIQAAKPPNGDARS